MAETLEYYINQKNTLFSQIASRSAHNAKIAEEIRRLEEAYNELGRIKRENDECADRVINDSTLEKIAGKAKWKGESRSNFNDIMKTDVYNDSWGFAGSIDAMQDEVGKALYKKLGEYDTGCGLLNSLNRSLNNVIGTIRNWTN